MRDRDDGASFQAVSEAPIPARGRRLPVLTAALVLAIGLTASRVQGADSNWIASAGDWSDANNWSGGEPNTATNAFVSNGGTATISQAGERSKTLSLGVAPGESGTLNIVSGWLSSPTQFIGVEGSGVVSQSDGNNTGVMELYLGYSPGSSGTYELSGKGMLALSGGEYIGYSGTGVFRQSGGTHGPVGYYTPPTLYLGYSSGSSGTYDLSGTGSLATTSEYVGYSGTGSFMQSGGMHRIQSALLLGYSTGASGTYDSNGNGSLVVGTIWAGYSGSGQIIHTDGNVNVRNTLALGFGVGSSGTYNLSGNARLYTGSAPPSSYPTNCYQYIGYGGTGVFTQTGGLNRALGTYDVLYICLGGYSMGGSTKASGTYLLSGDGILSASYLSVGETGQGLFEQRDGNVNVTSLGLGGQAGSSGTYRLLGPGRIFAKGETVGGNGTGLFEHRDGNNTVSIALHVGSGSGGRGTYLLDGNGRLTAGSERIGWFGEGIFQQMGGWNTVSNELVISWAYTHKARYEISGGTLTANSLSIAGRTGVDTAGTFSILDANATVIVTSLLTIGAGGSIQAVPGSAIHMTGSAFVNQSTDANLATGLANLRLIYEGADANADPFEVAGWDYGADANGFIHNFGLGTLQLGSENGDGRVVLVDLFDNNPDSNGTEALYLQSLIVNPGSALYLNGIHLYVGAAQVNAGDGALYGGGFISAGVPEPGTLAILALGGLALARRRRR